MKGKIITLFCALAIALTACSPKATPEPVLPTEEPVVIPTEEPIPPFIPGLITPTPPMYTGNLGMSLFDANYDWGCYTVTADDMCIFEGLSDVDTIAFAVYTENRGMSAGNLVNHWQLLENRMMTIWNCSSTLACTDATWKLINPNGIPYDSLTRDDRVRLAKYALSSASPSGKLAWFGWNAAFPLARTLGNPQTRKLLENFETSIDKWLDGGEIAITYYGSYYTPINALINDPAVMYSFLFIDNIDQGDEYLNSIHAIKVKEEIRDTRYFIYYLTFEYSN